MSVCPRCGTLTVGRDPAKDQMRTRIAALEAENERLQGAYGILHQEWVRALLRAEQDEGPQ